MVEVDTSEECRHYSFGISTGETACGICRFLIFYTDWDNCKTKSNAAGKLFMYCQLAFIWL